jgi:hypothetical protein
VTVTGDTAWVLEAKFAYRNETALKDKDPEPFGATAVQLLKRRALSTSLLAASSTWVNAARRVRGCSLISACSIS